MNSRDNHIPEDDLALFALALMPSGEAAQTADHLHQCDLCRGEVARMQGDLAVLAMSVEMQAPPAEASTRLMQAVARESRSAARAPQPEPVLKGRSSTLLDRERDDDAGARRSMGLAGWAGWAVAAGVAAFAGWQFHQQQDLRTQLATQAASLQQGGDAVRAQEVLQALTDPGAMQVALHQPVTPGTPAKPEGHAAYNAGRGELVFIASHLQPIAPDKTYELWLLPASGAAPVAAGLFRPDANGNASVVLPELPKNVAAKGFGVTVEATGGSSVPTPPIVLAGT